MSVKNNDDIRHTELNALNMEVETLRWQLSQTEANRQMHIALLKQIVTFLNRVKEHIENQKIDPISTTVLPKSININDLPRSRSVLHVSNNHDYAISRKKMSIRIISKSISNVNGYKDCTNFCSQSKLSSVSETETGRKLTEEMSRLITLANTVLSTRLPDLSSVCPDNRVQLPSELTEVDKNEEASVQLSSKSLNLIEENGTNTIVLNTSYNDEVDNGIANKFEDGKSRILSDFVVTQSPLICGLENDFSGVKLFEHEHPSSQSGFVASCEKVVQKLDRNEYNAPSNFIEDESGFSSMSSFQEIGIPIISIIPSPCKEVEYFEEITDETEKWNADAIELEKQSVKVFWV